MKNFYSATLIYLTTIFLGVAQAKVVVEFAYPYAGLFEITYELFPTTLKLVVFHEEL